MMNPQAMMQLIGALSRFKSDHPKFAGFIELFAKEGIPEDSVIEITVTRPGESGITANMKVTAADLELIQALRNMKP